MFFPLAPGAPDTNNLVGVFGAHAVRPYGDGYFIAIQTKTPASMLPKTGGWFRILLRRPDRPLVAGP